MPWSAVENLNSVVCQKGKYQAGRTSDGYEAARELWNRSHEAEMTVVETADLCRQCHRLAPFLFLNGNTFASVAKVALEAAFSNLSAVAMQTCRTAVGHYVAGTISTEELLPLLCSVQ
jgi:hypothetical protein